MNIWIFAPKITLILNIIFWNIWILAPKNTIFAYNIWWFFNFIFSDQLFQRSHQSDFMSFDGCGDLHRRRTQSAHIPLGLDWKIRLQWRIDHAFDLLLWKGGQYAQVKQQTTHWIDCCRIRIFFKTNLPIFSVHFSFGNTIINHCVRHF